MTSSEEEHARGVQSDYEEMRVALESLRREHGAELARRDGEEERLRFALEKVRKDAPLAHRACALRSPRGGERLGKDGEIGGEEDARGGDRRAEAHFR